MPKSGHGLLKQAFFVVTILFVSAILLLSVGMVRAAPPVEHIDSDGDGSADVVDPDPYDANYLAYGDWFPEDLAPHSVTVNGFRCIGGVAELRVIPGGVEIEESRESVRYKGYLLPDIDWRDPDCFYYDEQTRTWHILRTEGTADKASLAVDATTTPPTFTAAGLSGANPSVHVIQLDSNVYHKIPLHAGSLVEYTSSEGTLRLRSLTEFGTGAMSTPILLAEQGWLSSIISGVGPYGSLSIDSYSPISPPPEYGDYYLGHHSLYLGYFPPIGEIWSSYPEVRISVTIQPDTTFPAASGAYLLDPSVTTEPSPVGLKGLFGWIDGETTLGLNADIVFPYPPHFDNTWIAASTANPTEFGLFVSGAPEATWLAIATISLAADTYATIRCLKSKTCVDEGSVVIKRLISPMIALPLFPFQQVNDILKAPKAPEVTLAFGECYELLPHKDVITLVAHIIGKDLVSFFTQGGSSDGSIRLPLGGPLVPARVKIFDRNHDGFQDLWGKNPKTAKYPDIYQINVGMISGAVAVPPFPAVAREGGIGDFLVIAEMDFSILRELGYNGPTIVYSGSPKSPEDWIDTDEDGVVDTATKEFQVIISRDPKTDEIVIKPVGKAVLVDS